MFFLDDSSWQPYEFFREKPGKHKRGDLLKELIFDSPNFSEGDGLLSVEDQRWLFSVWLPRSLLRLAASYETNLAALWKQG